MCFSASASFVTSAALVPAGIYCVKTALRKNRAYLAVAVIPFAFSIQQFCEGLVWLGLGQDDPSLVQKASVVYLFFAVAFWPFWIPLSILFTKTRPGVRLFLGVLTALSLAWTWLYLPIPLQPDRWLTTEVVHHSVRYAFEKIPGFDLAPRGLWRLGYLLLISVPLVVSYRPGKSNPRGRTVAFLGGLVLMASFAVSYFVFWYAFTSVWCLFAALFSLILCHAFSRLPDSRPREHPPWGSEIGAGLFQNDFRTTGGPVIEDRKD